MIDRLRWFYRAWRYRLRVEKQEIRWLLANLQPGDCAVDVGAHKGAFTYWMRRRVGATGRVFAFEPQPVLADRLRRLVSGRGFDHIVVEHMGLSSAPGTLTLNIPGRHSSPSASFEDTQDTAQPGRALPVRVTTLDRYFDAGSPFRIKLIKCDAEGHELDVFRGARQVLMRDRPHLLFECESRHLGTGTPASVFDFLAELGYRGHFFGPGGIAGIEDFDAARHQADPDDAGYVNNFIFTHASGSGG